MSNVMGFRARTIQAAGSPGTAPVETLEIDVYDVIADSWWGGVNARQFRSQLKGSKAQLIKMRINSGGGDALEGVAIRQLLSEHPARVEADVDGLAASAATIILMAADEIRMAPGAFLMIHNASVGIYAGSEDLAKWAETLKKMDRQMADIYVARTGLDLKRVTDMMDAETWISADDAVAMKFADSVKPLKTAPAKKSAKAQAQMFASISLAGLQNVPDAVRASIEAARAQATLPLTSGEHQPGTARVDEETETMNQELLAILAALGVQTVAEANARISILTKIEKATGKTGDEAHGVVLAVTQDAAEVTGLRVKAAELQKLVDGNELDKCIAQAKADKKLTPDDETVLRAQVAAGEVTIKGAKALLDRKSPHPVLAASAQNKPAPVVASGSEISAETKVDGKAFAELNGRERAALRKSDPELYAQLLAASK
jgi:ATP-dependent Clp protease protease subunit